MSATSSQLAVFPGTFDPVTNGHLDVIRRGAKLFDRLVVAVGDNPQKQSMLPADTRAEILREVLADVPNCSVEVYRGLTVDLARRLGAGVILRGIRNAGDLQFESLLALTNRAVTGVETVFLITSPEHGFTSSSLIRQIAAMGGDISSMVPPAVLGRLAARAVGGQEKR